MRVKYLYQFLNKFDDKFETLLELLPMIKFGYVNLITKLQQKLKQKINYEGNDHNLLRNTD